MCRYDEDMANLEKRVQVLFSAEQYARLEAAARAEGLSVGAAIRRAVERRLAQSDRERNSAWDRIFDRADALPRSGSIDWDEEKDAFDRDILRDGTQPMKRAS